jgi:hypothetical protein
MKDIVQFILCLSLALTFGLGTVIVLDGCTANGDNTAQVQQLQQDFAFWSAEVGRLKTAVDALPPGPTRDKLSKDLATAEYFVAFFGALIPPVPTTQPFTGRVVTESVK